MKIAISSGDGNLDSVIDQRFGRCIYFIVMNTNEPEKAEAIENLGAIQRHGAGIKAAQQLADLKVEVIITGNLGPNATAVFEKMGIKAYHASGIANMAVSDFLHNKLKEISEVAEPHSGIVAKELSSEKIFFPLLEDKGENSEISSHFGHAPFFGLYDVEKKEFRLVENNLDHSDPNKSPIDQIEEAVHPTTIFAKGIGGRAINLIAEKGLKLKTGNYNTVKEVIDNLDKLSDQTQSCGHEQH